MTSPSAADPAGMRIRPSRPDDEEGVVRLLADTLGWKVDERHRKLLSWKHRLNPFGVSPGWIAEDESGLAGFRTLMRWEFICGDSIVRAARAVDTATAPRAQGRGVFRALTLRAVSDLAAEGVACIFNTPNTSSAPGYLSMGWHAVGRLPISFRPSGLRTLPKLRGARAPGDLWSIPGSPGESAAEALAGADEVAKFLSSVSPRAALSGCYSTNITVEFLQWRYGKCPIGYRIWLAGNAMQDGIVIFRQRRRGTAMETVIAEVIFPGDCSARFIRHTCRELLKATRSDYAVALGSTRPRGWVPLSRSGPLLTWRPLQWSGEVPGLSSWSLSTGDIELF